MFYKKGVDITNDKSMFNFLHDHFTYYTMSSWNHLNSIANDVKVHHLGLDGDEWVAIALLEDEEYNEINWMIRDWEADHKGYKVGFNGRSGGYLVLYSDYNNDNVLPDYIVNSDNYEDYKQYCKDYQGSVRGNRYELVDYTRLVQDFDKLCDKLRDYTNELSKVDYKKTTVENVVEYFNANYDNDLELCNFKCLTVVDGDKIDISEVKKSTSLSNILYNLLDNNKYGYKVHSDENYYWLED